ncbi:uncharacterized protein BXZ73DRAFT_100692 [Epithele typhae]|uniref:uncharacterized protein n=1 Tax=Epithele typhae TaxID=378194 RepID=UPI0020076E0F|nr:uncharacterized protein BXZ73DRAFT_100692 [Epithele typhae]KAH9934503.1 hypothetical protein BXZ73DRAFT_100692 [Epithele typhae]
MALIIDRLNDDILLLILYYLQRRDLRALSLTSKYLHTISSPKLWTVALIDRDFSVFRWHENIGTNARHIREMAIHVDDKALMLPDVLFATTNIRSLEISCIYLHFDDPRLSTALSGLCELRTLSCVEVQDKMLPMIQSIPSPNLTSLCLRYHENQNVSDHLPSLISAIRSFPRLYALILQYFMPTTAVDIASYPPFPSIQQLTLDGVNRPATDLVYLCPNVTSLELCLDHPRQGDPHESQPRWRPSQAIPRLTLTFPTTEVGDLMVSLLGHRGLCATHLRLESIVWEFTDDGISYTEHEPACRLPRVLAVLKPLSLYLEISATGNTKLSDRTGTLWQEVAAAAPRLRALVLHVDTCSDDTRWFPPDALAAELARLPLVCVHLKADPEMLGGSKGQAERPRLRALAAFPGRLAAAIPTLRVVGVSDGWRESEGMRSERWWRVEREDGDGVSRWLFELWREDGERALRLVQNEAFCMSDLDDIYSEKCCYVRG